MNYRGTLSKKEIKTLVKSGKLRSASSMTYELLFEHYFFCCQKNTHDLFKYHKASMRMAERNRMNNPKKHLRLDCYMITEHAQEFMKRVGITYQHSTPQSIYDEWWFWNCENVPAELPKELHALNLHPMDQIGYGLSKEKAIEIRDYQKNKEI